MGNSSRFDKEKELHEGINTLIQKKLSIIGNTRTGDVYINSLKKQKNDLQGKIELNTSVAQSLKGNDRLLRKNTRNDSIR